MDTAILLISADRADCLEHSLPLALAQEGAEVTVIDNASSDATGQLARDSGARHLRLPERLSWAAANNRGIEATEGEAVLLLNADCFLDPGFLAAGRPWLDAETRAGTGERVGSVTPKLLRTEGPLPEQRLDAIDCIGMAVDRRRKNTLLGHGRPGMAYDEPGPAFGPDGAAALLRRDMLDECAIDGHVLDEALEKWASDVDLIWRAHVLGWRSVYEPRAIGWHIRSYSPSTRAAVPQRDRRVQFRNRYVMMASNDTPKGLARDLPRILAYELLALGHVLLRERHLLGGYAEARNLLPRARRRAEQLAGKLEGRPRAEVPFGLEPAP